MMSKKDKYKEIEKMHEINGMPAECEKCRKIYNFKDALKRKHQNMTIKDVTKELYGKVILLCPRCAGKK